MLGIMAGRRGLAIMALAALATLILVTGGLYFVRQQFAGLCNNKELPQLRDIRTEILSSVSATDVSLSECQDSSDDLYVSALSNQSFDCQAITVAFERSLGKKSTPPRVVDQELAVDAGPYIDVGKSRVYLYCKSGNLSLTSIPLSDLRSANE